MAARVAISSKPRSSSIERLVIGRPDARARRCCARRPRAAARARRAATAANGSSRRRRRESRAHSRRSALRPSPAGPSAAAAPALSSERAGSRSCRYKPTRTRCRCRRTAPRNPPTLGTSTSSSRSMLARKIERRRQLAARERDQIGAALRRFGSGARGLGARDLRGAPLRAIEIDEHAHLAAQDRRHDGRQDVVDGAELVAALRLHLVGIRRHEDDRRVRRPAVLADELRRLDAVDVGHVDVEHDDGELALEQLAQRLGAGARRARGSRRDPRAPRGTRAAYRPNRRRREC